MELYKKHRSIAALINRVNVDTDQIIPKEFMKRIERTGLGIHLFQYWRYDKDGNENPDFELNNPAFSKAAILVTGDNFGCGSSREHAPWAIKDYGFNTIVSTSFADIFYNNCFKNGILPVIVSKQQLIKLMDEISTNEGVEFVVDLEAQKLTTPGGITINFVVDKFRKKNLLEGLDEIDWTLQYQNKIIAFEKRQKQQLPWLWK